MTVVDWIKWSVQQFNHTQEEFLCKVLYEVIDQFLSVDVRVIKAHLLQFIFNKYHIFEARDDFMCGQVHFRVFEWNNKKLSIWFNYVSARTYYSLPLHKCYLDFNSRCSAWRTLENKKCISNYFRVTHIKKGLAKQLREMLLIT